MVEYAVLLVLMGVVGVVVLMVLGNQVRKCLLQHLGRFGTRCPRPWMRAVIC